MEGGSSPVVLFLVEGASGSRSRHAFDAPVAPFTSWESVALIWSGRRGWGAPERRRRHALAATEARSRGGPRRGAPFETAMAANDAEKQGDCDGQDGEHACVTEARRH